MRVRVILHEENRYHADPHKCRMRQLTTQLKQALEVAHQTPFLS